MSSLSFYRTLYRLLCLAGKPWGGLRPRRMYDVVGRRAYPKPEFSWVRNRWGAELFLSPSYHIDRRILAWGTYDESLHRMLERLLQPGMVCMDVGANLGEVAIHMASKVGPKGTVYAFEPVSAVYERLLRHVEHNQVQDIVRTFALALSNQKGKFRIHCADPTADNQGLASLVGPRDERLILSEEVFTTTLDDFVAKEGIRQVHLIKIDIQGAEPFLLEGGANVFRDHSPDLLIEISPADLQRVQKSSRDLIACIEQYGYRVYHCASGQIGSRIRASEVRPTFHAPNVYCTKNTMSAMETK